MIAHALWRSFLLIAPGVFLRSMGRSQTNYTFEDTITQIGLDCPFLFAPGWRPERDHWIAPGSVLVYHRIAPRLVLVCARAAFALYPLPGSCFEYSKVGVPADRPHLMTGFEGRWNKNSNLARVFDVWFLNLFPRKEAFVFNGGDYATLSFIPALGTMILGLLAAGILRSERMEWAKVARLAVAGLIGLAAG